MGSNYIALKTGNSTHRAPKSNNLDAVAAVVGDLRVDVSLVDFSYIVFRKMISLPETAARMSKIPLPRLLSIFKN